VDNIKAAVPVARRANSLRLNRDSAISGVSMFFFGTWFCIADR
jgi:hypothetical protein